jgi:hypothetical protein
MQLLCAPNYPDKEPYGLAVMLHYLDYSITFSDNDHFDAAVLWQDETYVKVPEVLAQIALDKPVINLNCVDISKRRVEEAFKKIFGLTSLIDPLTYQGKCIKKPDGNAIRHGFVVECPQTSADQDWVYQELIETRVNGLQIEYRTPVILGEIPLVYVSQRDYPTGDIRDCKRHKLTPTLPDKVFSRKELDMILAFSKEIGMDLGELDIMRSTENNQIYIIDANKTAAGYGLENRANWSPGDRKKVVEVISKVFEKNLNNLVNGAQTCMTRKVS